MRRPVLIVIAVAAGIVALLIVAVALVLATMDVNGLAQPLRAQVKAATGRDLTIAGLSLKLSLEPRIEMRDVTFGNAPWAHAPALVTAKRVDAQLALVPLLKRRLEIRRLTLVEPVIALETNAAGRGNWEFGNPPEPGKDAPVATSAGNAAGLAVGIGDVDVQQGMLTYRDGRTGAVTRVAIESFALHAGDLQAPVNASFRGVIDGVPVAMTGNAGPLADLMARRWPYPLNLEADVAGRKAAIQTKLRVVDDVTRLESIDAKLGESPVRGTITLATHNGRRMVSMSLRSPRLKLSDLTLPAAVVVAGTPQKGSVTTPPGGRDAYVFGTRALPLGALRDIDATGDLAIDTLELGGERRADAVRVEFTLRNGQLEVPVLRAALLGGNAEGHLAMNADGASSRIDAHLAGHALDLGALLATSGLNWRVHGGRTSVALDVVARGDSPHAWASTTTGEASMVVGPATFAEVPTSVRAAADSPLGQLAMAVNPLGAGHGPIELRCAVVRLPLRDGVAHIKHTIALETDRIGVSASGVVDLRDETLDLALHPRLHAGAGVDLAQLGDLVRWSGPWRNPRVTVEPTASAAALAGLAAALGGQGLPGMERLPGASPTPTGSPCAAASGRAPAPAARVAPAARDATAIGRPGSAPAEELGKALGRLFGR